MSKYKIIATLFLCCASLFANAQRDWVLKREEDSIKIYTRNAENSSFKTVKSEFYIHARLTQFVAFLLDVEKQSKWVYNNKSSRLIRRNAPNEVIFYSEIGLPWPCANRDYISHVTIKQAGPKTVTIEAHSEPNLEPSKEGKVRVKVSNANWEVTSVGPDLLKINYVVQFDPAGGIPAWLVNMFVTKAPYETFRKLQEEVRKSDRNVKLDFIKE